MNVPSAGKLEIVRILVAVDILIHRREGDATCVAGIVPSVSYPSEVSILDVVESTVIFQVE